VVCANILEEAANTLVLYLLVLALILQTENVQWCGIFFQAQNFTKEKKSKE
jgi:hypothetical protein